MKNTTKGNYKGVGLVYLWRWGKHLTNQLWTENLRWRIIAVIHIMQEDKSRKTSKSFPCNYECILYSNKWDYLCPWKEAGQWKPKNVDRLNQRQPEKGEEYSNLVRNSQTRLMNLQNRKLDKAVSIYSKYTSLLS